MATFYSEWTDHYRLRLDIAETVNTSDNSSNLTLTLYMQSESSTYNFTDSSNFWISLDGALVFDDGKYAMISSNWVTVASITLNGIPHKADGSLTKTFAFGYKKPLNVDAPSSMSASIVFNGTNISQGDTFTLAASGSAAANQFIIGSSRPVTFSSSRYHLVQAYSNGVAYELFRDKTGTSYTITAAQVNVLANYLGSSSSATVELRCYTYTGGLWDDAHTLIGVTTKNVTVSRTASAGVTISISEGNSYLKSKNVGLYLQGQSSLAVKITATPATGTTITQIKTTCQAQTYYGAEFTTMTLVSAGNFTLNVTVTDSAGETATVSKSFTVTEYSPPTITNFEAKWTTTTAYTYSYNLSATILSGFSFSGTHKRTKVGTSTYYTSTAPTVAQLNAGKVSNSANSSTAVPSTERWEMTATISDGIFTVSKTVPMTGNVLVSWSADHTSLGIGQLASSTSKTITIADDYDIMYRAKTLTKYIIDLIYPVGAIYMSYTLVAPSSIFPGTNWTQIASGRAIIGAGSLNGTNYTAGSTGGATTSTLRALIGAVNNSTSSIGYQATDAVTGQNYAANMGVKYTATPGAISNVNHSTVVLESNGTQPSRMQPYLAVYIWRRTA